MTDTSLDRNSEIMDRERIANTFLDFAAHAFPGSSALYEKLACGFARSPDLIGIAMNARPGMPLPNLMFSAVNYLLARGDRTEPLATFYPEFSATPNTNDDPFPLFRDYCIQNSDAIINLIRARRVQTNEVARCALLLPAFEVVSQREGRRPFAIIEIGASAGLNLLWDHYEYGYSDGRNVTPESTWAPRVEIRCDLRETEAPIPLKMPAIASRLGIDLNPLDLTDDDTVAWLSALIWPEHADRRELLSKAAAVARKDPPPVISGDANVVLPEAIEAIDAGTTVCVFHSFVLNQFSENARTGIMKCLSAASAGRTIYRIGVEALTSPETSLELETFRKGQSTSEYLGRCNPHGRWLEWGTRLQPAP